MEGMPPWWCSRWGCWCLQVVKKKHRTRMLEFFIDVARECFNIGNFNSMMAIICEWLGRGLLPSLCLACVPHPDPTCHPLQLA